MDDPGKTPKVTEADEFLQKEPDALSEGELAKISGGMAPKATLDPSETSGCCGG